ncbi:unnamed protein product [Lactuca virosa]|uniref:Uncharacterized protein n=1 Tax=Lactuca virosa TaxID=75947 RepID=A0AAU9PPI0_9ASTR|nr:unnamed protein product [Lactuca virosa]
MAPDSPTRSESSMDSALDVSQSKGSRSIRPNLRWKGVKLDFDCGKPPTVFTRATLIGFILKKRSESVEDDQLIKMSPPKQKCSSRESRSRSLNDLSDPPTPDVTSSEHTSEDRATTIFHECPIEPDNKMKHVEDEAELSYLGKSESETITGGLLEKIP